MSDIHPHITILMPVYNGAPFLADQIQSIVDQTHTAWTLHASDDGSADNSLDTLQSWADKLRNMRVYQGPKRGQMANIVSLLKHAAPELDQGGWLAFADQDDLWLPHRLSRGVDHLRGQEGPALYCARTLVADQNLTNPRPSKTHSRPPSFQNALVQNIASGNTILLNASAVHLIRQAADHTDTVFAPDWWIYQMITGAGGTVIFDPEPALIYRQHGRNQFGENRSAAAGGKRIRQILNGQFKTWVTGNITALLRSDHVMTDANRACLHEFARLKDRNPVSRMKALRQLGIHRQSRAGTVAIFLAALLGRL